MRIVLDGVFNHTGRGFWPFHHVLETGGGSPYRELVPLRRGPPRRRRVPPGVSAARHAAARPRVRGVVGDPGAAQAGHREPAGARVPDDGRRALAALRGRRLAARRPGGDQRRRLLAGVPAALPGRPPRCLSRRRDLARRARVAARRPARRDDGLPASPRPSSASPAGPGSTWASSTATTSIRTTSCRSTGRRSPPGSRTCSRRTRRRRSPRNCASSGRTTRPGCGRSSATTSRACGSRCCSRRRCPAARASTTATRSGWPATAIPTAGGRSRGTSRAGTGPCAPISAACSGSARTSPPSVPTRSWWSARPAAPSPMCGGSTARDSSSPSTRAMTRCASSCSCPASATARPLEPIRLDGADGTVSEARAVVRDGSAVLDLGPRSGSILRLG